MYKRLFWLLPTLVIVTLLAVACGGQTPEVEEVQEQDEQIVAETVQATEEGMEVTEEATEEMAAATAAASAEPAEDVPLGEVVIAPGDPIVIASVLVIAGPNETLGVDSQTGIEVAIQEQGDLLGHAIELKTEDGGCSAEGGQTAATKVASDPSVVAVIGHSCSSSCTPAAPIYNDAGLTMISPSCTAPALTDPATHVPSFLRTAHNDKVQGRVMAEFVYNKLGLTTAATIHDGSPYAEQLQQVFADTFSALGGTITAQEAVNVGDTDMRPVLTSIAVDSPEFLYYPVFIAEGGFLTSQAREIAGLEETVLAGADGMISPDFLEAAGEAANGMYISGPDLAFSGEKYDAFLSGYVELLGQEPVSAFHAHAYDAAQMIFKAIEEVGTTDEAGNTVIGREALRDALYATSGYEGITGMLSCDEEGDCADPAIAINQIQEGEYVPVYGGATEEDHMDATVEATAEVDATAQVESTAEVEATAKVESTAEVEATTEVEATNEAATEELQDEEAADLSEGEGEADVETDFPLPEDAQSVQLADEESGLINYQTGLTLEEVVAFYRDALTAQGLTERTINTVINDQAISIVFDGASNGKAIVVQGFPLSEDIRNVSVRYE